MDQEERAQQQALRHTHDMAALRDQLAEAESAKSSLQNEVGILKTFFFFFFIICRSFCIYSYFVNILIEFG